MMIINMINMVIANMINIMIINMINMHDNHQVKAPALPGLLPLD